MSKNQNKNSYDKLKQSTKYFVDCSDSDSDYVLPDVSPSHCSEYMDLCESETDLELETQPEPQPEPQPETQPETQQEPQQEPQPEPQTQVENFDGNGSEYDSDDSDEHKSESINTDSDNSSVGSYDYNDSFIDDKTQQTEPKLTQEQLRHVMYCNNNFCNYCFIIHKKYYPSPIESQQDQNNKQQ